MHDMVQRLQYVRSEDVMIIVPYNAQLYLLLALRDGAYRNALDRASSSLAR